MTTSHRVYSTTLIVRPYRSLIWRVILQLHTTSYVFFERVERSDKLQISNRGTWTLRTLRARIIFQLLVEKATPASFRSNTRELPIRITNDSVGSYGRTVPQGVRYYPTTRIIWLKETVTRLFLLRTNHRDRWASRRFRSREESRTNFSRRRRDYGRIEDAARRDTRGCRRGATSTWYCAPRVGAWGSSPRSSICTGSTGRRSASRRWPCRSPSSGVSAGSTPTSTSGRSEGTRAAAASRSERGAHLKKRSSR